MPKVSEAYLESRRRQILDAAAACFARDGFHHTSMADIVRASGVSAGLVYRYFASKDDLITAIIADWHAERRALVRPDQDVAELKAAYLDLLRSTADPRNRIGIQAWAETLRSPQIRDLARDGVDELRASATGVLGPGADPLARVFIAVYQGLVLQNAWDDAVDTEAVVRAVELLLDADDRPRSAGGGGRP
jgi:AcrR family transcriptional regulator